MLASVKSGTFCQQNCADRNTEKKKQRQWLGDKSKYIFVCGNWQRCAINAKTDKNFEELVKSKGNPIQREKKLLLSLPDILAKRNSIQLYVIALIFIINQVRTDTNTYTIAPPISHSPNDRLKINRKKRPMRGGYYDSNVFRGITHETNNRICVCIHPYMAH